MRAWIRRCGGALAVGAAAVLVAACGSAGSSSTARAVTRTETTTATVTVRTTTATSSATSGPGSGASAAAVAAGCAPAHTAVLLGPAGAATGHAGIVLLFRNSGTAACTLTGYPGATLVGPHRQLDIRRTPQGYLGGLSPQARANPVVRLAPGRVASALLQGEDFNPQTTAACPRYAALLVTPPNQTVTVRLNRSLALCDPQIHPVVPGASGRQRP